MKIICSLKDNVELVMCVPMITKYTFFFFWVGFSLFDYKVILTWCHCKTETLNVGVNIEHKYISIANIEKHYQNKVSH